MVRQLLPLQKCSVDVVCCEPVGTVYDSKGNKIENSHLAQGLASNKYQVVWKKNIYMPVLFLSKITNHNCIDQN